MESLESRLTPTGGGLGNYQNRPQPVPFLFNGSEPGVQAVVSSYYANNNQLAFQAEVMGSGFTGGVRVAVGDINNDGIPDIISAAGPGGGPRVQVLDGATGTQLPGTIGSFFAYDSAFSGGVQVASADANRDGYDDIITAPGAGGGPNIKIFSGYDGSTLASFFAFDSAFTGGVTIATGDFNGDGQLDIVAGAGAGGGPNVKIFDITDLNSISQISGSLGSFWAFDSSYTGGVSLGTNPIFSDLTGDGVPDILVSQGPGTGSLIRVIDGTNGSLAAEFSPLGSVTGGLRVATGLVDDDAIPDIVVGVVPGVTSNPLVYSSGNFVQNTSLSTGTVTPLGTFSGKSAKASLVIEDAAVSTTGSLTLGSTVEISVVLTPDSESSIPTGTVNLAVNYPDAGLTQNLLVELTSNGTQAVANIPLVIAADGDLSISGTYSGDQNYRYYPMPIIIKPVPKVPTPLPAPQPPPPPTPGIEPDPVGSTSPRIRQTVLPILFGNLNPGGYDGYWLFSHNDLPGNGLLGLNRTWSNRPGLASVSVGSGSMISDMPRLKAGSGSTIQLIVNSSKVYEIDKIDNNYLPRYRQPFKVYSQSGNELVVATDSGRVFTFFDLSTSVPAAQRGTFKSMLDEGGNLTSVVSWNSDGRPTEITTVNKTNSGNGLGTGADITESVLYSYSTSSPNVGMLSQANLRRKVGSGSYSTVLTATYTYHDGSSNAYGLDNDLKTVEVRNANNEIIDQQYYRYYKSNSSTGYAHGLKYALGFESYQRILNDLGNPESLSDTQLAPYADHFFEYGSNQRITKHVFAGLGDSGSGGGLGTYTYSYVTSSSTNQGFNLWKTAMTETNPEGAVTTSYTNAAGQLLLSSFKESASSTQEWAKYNHYDNYGMIDFQAEASAVDTSSAYSKYKPGWQDLVNFNYGTNATAIKDGEGLVRRYTYASNTTASATSAGDAAGYLKAVELRRGETDSYPTKTNAYTYLLHEGNGVNTYLPANTYTYLSNYNPIKQTSEKFVTTTYQYDGWFTYTVGSQSIESAQPKIVTVTLPPVETAQNGPGGTTGATMSTSFDIYGRPIWFKDAGGALGYVEYDGATMASIKSIVDVNTGTTSDFKNLPNGWSRTGLHLKSTFVVDAYGRTTKFTDPKGGVAYAVYKDATQEQRIYQGWNGSTNTPTGPILLVRDDLARGYSEAVAYTATPTVSGGAPTGQETTSGVVSLARNATNIAGQIVSVDQYFDLAGLTYSTTASLGTEGVNFLRLRYAYDDAGRMNRVQTPSGTIYRSVFDKLGRSLTNWVGLDDTPNSGVWSPTNLTGTDLFKTIELQYDTGGVGDSNLTQITEIPGGTEANRVSRLWYDWRNRAVAAKSGVSANESSTTQVNRPLVFLAYNDVNQVTGVNLYDGDNVTPSMVAGSPVVGSAPLVALSTFAYDNLGQLYKEQTQKVDPVNGLTNTTTLTTNHWYDSRGNLIKSHLPGGLVAKASYDGLSRLVTSFHTDGGGDSGYSDASTVSGDTVLSQDDFTYDENSNVIQTIHRDRFHNATGTGALTGSTSRAYYATAYFDVLNRVTSTVDVGTNPGSTFSRSSTVPSRSDAILVTDYGYNANTGILETITDPRGLVTKSFADALGRVTKTIEAFDGGAITATTNKTTEFAYDSSGRFSHVKAYRATGDYSQTQYIYGVTTSASGINSNDILSSVRYPDKTTGNASSSITESYTVNALGEVKTATDRLGTTHEYGRDLVGRLILDKVTALGSGVDNAVMRQETAYDPQGNPYLFTSYTAASGGSIVNQVQNAFNGFGQLISQYQSHSGAVNTSSTPRVQYNFVEGAGTANNSRQTGMVYPNGRTLTYDYASGLDTNISRLTAIKDGSTTLESYQYLGIHQAVVRAHPQPGVDLTFVKQTGESNGDGGDQYTGLDRFGRIVDQRWIKTSSGTATDRFKYGYDRNGNVLFKDNKVLTSQSELYHANGATAGYDSLNQLAAFSRGTLSDDNGDGTPDTISSPSRSQSWTPDGQGNFTTVTTNGVGQSRTHDKQNQVTAVGGVALTYDAAGNLTKDEQLGRSYKYDAWNRLVSVTQPNSTTILASYSYDALGRRIMETAGGVTRDLYHSAGWQVIEERVGNVAQAQFVWSPVYVDAMILRDRNSDGNSANGLEERLYVQHDANFNVTALIDTSGNVVERFVYDPYGQVTILSPDGTTVRTTSNYAWQHLHQGGRQDAATGLLYFRHRDYSASLMRWTTNDPIGFAGGDTNTYRYVANGPGNGLDPSGLAAVDLVHSTTTEAAPKVITGGLQAGKDGMIWFNSADAPAGSGASAKSTIHLKYRVDLGNARDIPDEVMKDVAKKARNSLKGSPLKGPEYGAAYGRAIGDALADWMKQQPESVFRRPSPSGRSGYQYIVKAEYWKSLKKRLIRISGEGALKVIELLGKLDDASGAVAKTKLGSGVRAARRIAGRTFVGVLVADSIYEIYTSKNVSKTITKKVGGITGALAGGWAGGKGGAYAGAGAALLFGQLGPQAAVPEEAVTIPLASAIGGMVGGIGGAITGGIWGENIMETIYDTIFEEGLEVP